MTMSLGTSSGGLTSAMVENVLIPADKSSKKLKIQTKMISIIRKSLKDDEKLKEFNGCIEHAKSLTEKKRYYFGKFSAYYGRGNYLVEEESNQEI